MSAITTEIFIQRARAIHGDKYDYSQVEYVNASTKVFVICSEHGGFWMLPHNHLRGQGCPRCGNNKKNQSNTIWTPDDILCLYDSEFARLCKAIFEIANMEHHHRNNRFLHRAPKKECTDFEYRFQRTDNTLHGLLNTLFNLNIALSLISQYPSDEYMLQYHYSAKGYSIYHYSVICHILSTIRDLYRKLINQVCKCGVIENNQGIISWTNLKVALSANELKFGNVLQCLNDFHTSFDKYINDRQRSSHDGMVYNNIFNDMELTEFVSDIVESQRVKERNFQYIRGNKENKILMNKSKQDYMYFLKNIISDAYNNANKLFDALQTILLKDLCVDLASNISCWNRVPSNTYDNIEDYLNVIRQTQILVYLHEPDEALRKTSSI